MGYYANSIRLNKLATSYAFESSDTFSPKLAEIASEAPYEPRSLLGTGAVPTAAASVVGTAPAPQRPFPTSVPHAAERDRVDLAYTPSGSTRPAPHFIEKQQVL